LNQAETICTAVEEIEQKYSDTRLRCIPAIARILGNVIPRPRSRLHIKSHLDGPGASRRSTNLGLLAGLKNPDLAILRQENQNPTHVTPLIASLARGFVNEQLVVIGPPPPRGKDDVAVVREKKSLWSLIERAKGGSLDVDWQREDKITQRSNYLRKVYVGGQVYKVSSFHSNSEHNAEIEIFFKPGDFVLVPYGKYGAKNMTLEWPKQIAHLPSSASIANYFWCDLVFEIHRNFRTADHMTSGLRG